MITIKDVAQDAGVSVGTVSNVINGGKVSEKRRLQVEQSIQKLGYQVNTIARGMRTQRTDYVVVILPNITNPFFAMLLQELERSLAAVGKQTILCISEGDSREEAKYIEMAKANKVDGIIGVTYSDIEEYVEDSMDFVSIERHFRSKIPCISSDNYLGGRLAAENLSKRGARNLLCFQILMSVDNEVRKRRLGFEEYCMEHEISCSSVTFSEQQVPSVYSSFSSRNLVRNVLRAHLQNTSGTDGIDGIFAGTDHLALVLIEELEAMGLRVPEDVQVIGYDGLRVLNAGEQYVSSIYQDAGLVARTSVDCLIRLLNGEQVKSILDLDVAFVDGGTTLPLTENKFDGEPE